MFVPLTNGPGGSRPPTQPVKGVGRGAAAALRVTGNTSTLTFVPDKGERLQPRRPATVFLVLHHRRILKIIFALCYLSISPPPRLLFPCTSTPPPSACRETAALIRSRRS